MTRKPGIALLGVANTYVDAMTWEALLRAEKIPCLVRDAGATIGELQGPLAFGSSTYEVYVPGSALQRAKELLGDELKTPSSSSKAARARDTGLAWLWLAGFIVSFAVAVGVMLGLR
jgi:hypothetical protein